jgi:hypothetical protein
VNKIETPETRWYRNTETGVVWEIVKGSPQEKRIVRELTDDPDNSERRYERVAAPEGAEKAPEPTRAELNAEALAAGVTEPEKLANKQAVIDAITAAKQGS